MLSLASSLSAGHQPRECWSAPYEEVAGQEELG